MSAKVIIKKYENRRLYDTSASRYVNLEDVARMIREGTEVQVVDAKTGEDLTRVTLTQIIVEDAREPAGLPLELLRQLIVASDKARQDFMMWYLNTAFETYRNLQSAIHNQWTDVRSAAAAPFEQMRRFFVPSSAAAERSELDELRSRVAELESKLKEERRGKRAPRKVKRP